MAAIVRKHTRFGLDRFREALSRAVTGLDQFRQAEAARIERFMRTEVSDVVAEALMLRAFEPRHRQPPPAQPAHRAVAQAAV